VIVLVLKGTNLAVQIAIGGAAYFAVLFLTGGINRKMVRTILGEAD
jgi:hypothetical protein